MGAHAFVVHASEWGSSKIEAEVIYDIVRAGLSNNRGEHTVDLVSFEDIDAWLPHNKAIHHIIIYVLGTAENGLPPCKCRDAYKQVTDARYDPREEHWRYCNITYGIIARGDSSYGSDFCKWGLEFDKTMKSLGAQRGFRCSTQDVSHQSKGNLSGQKAATWLLNLLTTEESISAAIDTDSDIEDVSGESSSSSDDDIEDFAGSTSLDAPSAMINDAQRKVLTKQGYKLIGTHSAVKLCRWTKHQLRGRGGCYKHTFYGINSHQCMEATSSLACANKCVFCWRHHKNPVGTSWRWKTDDPIYIVNEGLKAQEAMIREYRGVPGVEETGRFKEGLQVKHCALSLVGEPIMYPHINELLEDLHKRHISTFLVTNAQFPEQIRQLTTCTQLYVSIDGTNPEQLKRIDRPLFKDYWERFRRSLLYVRDRRERTVYRVTLVKDYNDMDPQSYVELIALGAPDLIELKGVTFAGPSLTGGVRMANVPTHSEVIEFAKSVVDHLKAWRENVDPTLPLYSLALEHEHSCSILLAQEKFRGPNGQWRLWIDFEKFFEWAQREDAVDCLEYSIEAPEWAIYGADQRGFDPSDVRKYKIKPKGTLRDISEETSSAVETHIRT